VIEDVPRHYPVSGSTRQFEGGVIAVRTDEVVIPSGETARRDVVEHPGAVAVIAIDDQNRVLFIQQYRHPPGRMLWEPPAGLLDEPGESPIEAAARELFEETGYRADRWDLLVDAFTSPGMSDEAIRIFLAREISEVPPDERHVGEHEEADMPIQWVPLDEATAAILGGRIHNPLAVMGVLAARCALTGTGTTFRGVDTPWPERPVSGVKG
jgi:ADP-ribose pyrophosphatase